MRHLPEVDEPDVEASAVESSEDSYEEEDSDDVSDDEEKVVWRGFTEDAIGFSRLVREAIDRFK